MAACIFVSSDLANDDVDWATGGNTHAWVQAYVPGPGWVDFDPSGGHVGNENLIRVAVAGDPRRSLCKAHGSDARRTIWP